jgi:hypothetical protein
VVVDLGEARGGLPWLPRLSSRWKRSHLRAHPKPLQIILMPETRDVSGLGSRASATATIGAYSHRYVLEKHPTSSVPSLTILAKGWSYENWCRLLICLLAMMPSGRQFDNGLVFASSVSSERNEWSGNQINIPSGSVPDGLILDLIHWQEEE